MSGAARAAPGCISMVPGRIPADPGRVSVVPDLISAAPGCIPAFRGRIDATRDCIRPCAGLGSLAPRLSAAFPHRNGRACHRSSAVARRGNRDPIQNAAARVRIGAVRGLVDATAIQDGASLMREWPRSGAIPRGRSVGGSCPTAERHVSRVRWQRPQNRRCGCSRLRAGSQITSTQFRRLRPPECGSTTPE
jgi:hypothetical protein